MSTITQKQLDAYLSTTLGSTYPLPTLLKNLPAEMVKTVAKDSNGAFLADRNAMDGKSFLTKYFPLYEIRTADEINDFLNPKTTKASPKSDQYTDTQDFMKYINNKGFAGNTSTEESRYNGIRYIKVTGLSFNATKQFFEDNFKDKFKIEEGNYNLSGLYLTNLKVNFFKKDFFLVVADPSVAGVESYIKRKLLTPQNLGLCGKTFDNVTFFKQEILNGLNTVVADADVKDALISLVDVLDKTKTEFVKTPVLDVDSSIITSDFGEVLSAYNDVMQGYTVEFPLDSNEAIGDYFRTKDSITEIIDSKGEKGLRKNSFKSIKDQLKKLEENQEVGLTAKILWSLADNDKFTALNEVAKLDKFLGELVKLFGNSFSEASLKQYVATNTYQDFKLKTANILQQFGNENTSLGLAEKEPKDQDEFFNSVLFLLYTWMSGLWGMSDASNITAVIKQATSTTNKKFIEMEYNLAGNSFKFVSTDFNNVVKWGMKYWGNSSSPLNNWPGFQAYA